MFHEDELNIINEYTKESKIFTLIVVNMKKKKYANNYKYNIAITHIHTRVCIYVFMYICSRIFAVTYNLYAISLISPCILNILLYSFSALDNVDLTLPFSVNINITKAGLLYYILLIYQIISLYLLMTIAGICLSSYLIAIQHACSQFSVIVYMINNIKYISFKLNYAILQTYSYCRLKIRQPFRNQKYIKNVPFDGILNEELNWIIDIITRYRRVTELIFQLPSTLKINIEIIEQTIYVVGSMFTIYANFYCGQKLINHSNTTFKELCQVPFYTFSISTQKLLLFSLTRSMKPCVLSIGGFFVSSHEVFAGVRINLMRSIKHIYLNMYICIKCTYSSPLKLVLFII
ncbi:LOW QUALITY PROTEIN: hypothetical protein V1478_015646 [Vespula squamosa]|uniref:Odorant receptor n=1 Tax=Vespula squamosa TaxID=30214 RepID=A0ABD2A1G4_VESSQ